MVVIPLKGEPDIEDWVILEFQGEIDCFNQHLHGQVYPIGSMGLSSVKKDIVELTIGYHKLEGKVVALQKPLAMLEKERLSCDPESHAVAYLVRGLVRKKILFTARPRTLISKPVTR